MALLCLQSNAQPLLSSSEVLEGHKIYRDGKKPTVYYYMPFDYQLVKDASGKPEFNIMQMRYTGTRATADAGAMKYNNLLQFRVAVDPLQQQKVTLLKAAVKKKYPGSELRPVPVRKFSSVLVFASVTDSMPGDDSVKIVKAGNEATDENAAANNSYWTDRMITLRLNNFDAQLLESALKNKQSALSFSYAFYTIFSEADASSIDVYGSKTVRKQLRDYFDSEIKNKEDSNAHITLLKADAISLNVDVNKYPGLIQKIDINERLPAKYPLFDVYCYDFNNDLRADLFAKKIEIKASSVNGSDITTAFSFRQSQPDLYAKSIRFPYAVRFDKPFYYRVTEITNDGEATVTPWKEKKDWSEILDITSAADKVVHKPKATGDED